MRRLPLLIPALAVLLCQTRAASPELVARFDGEGKLTGLENRITGEHLDLVAGEQFAFMTGAGEVLARNCRPQAVRRTPRGLEVAYQHPQFLVEVSYELRPENHFLEKRIVVRHRGTKPFAITRFSVHRWTAGSGRGALVLFQHGQCLTFFARQPRGGFFFGVGAPFGERLDESTDRVDLAYPVNLVFEPGSTYAAETAYWGVYRRTGRLAPPVPARIDECVLSGVQPDVAESEAMLRMVEKLAPPPRGTITVSYNGYQGGLSYGDYSDADGRDEARRDLEVGENIREMFGETFVQPANAWFGAFRQAHQLASTDTGLPSSPVRDRVLRHLRDSGLKPLSWVCWKSINGWMRPPVGPYAPDRVDWQANARENCPAHTRFTQWLTSILLRDMRGRFAGYIVDEAGPTIPRYYLKCAEPGHGHVPGDISYPYFYRRREFYRRLRATFGGEFELQAQRPQMDAGVFDAVYLNTLFTFSESGTAHPYPLSQADRLREWSRIRRNYTFVPSYMDQVFIQPGLESTDYLMLSILAVSSNYLFVSPATQATLKEHNAQVNAWSKESSRYFARRLREFPEADKKRVRYWLDWARAQGAYMDHVIDLPDWPGGSKPDGYLRIRDGRGFAFLFNPGRRRNSIVVPLDESAGLSRCRSYHLTQIHPSAPAGAVLNQASAEFQLEPRSAYLIRIDPT